MGLIASDHLPFACSAFQEIWHDFERVMRMFNGYMKGISPLIVVQSKDIGQEMVVTGVHLLYVAE